MFLNDSLARRPWLYFTRAETAAELGISRRMVSYWERKGWLPPPEKFLGGGGTYHREPDLQRLGWSASGGCRFRERCAGYKRKILTECLSIWVNAFMARHNFGTRAVAGEFNALLPGSLCPHERVIGGGIVCNGELYLHGPQASLVGEMQLRQMQLPITKLDAEKLPPAKGSLVLVIAGPVRKLKRVNSKEVSIQCSQNVRRSDPRKLKRSGGRQSPR